MTKQSRIPSIDRGPLRVMFLLTTMPVGGAETLLVNLVRRLDRRRFLPEIACLKDLDELGELMSREVPTSSNYLSHKYDLRVLPRLVRRMRKQRVDALVTVGAGDKMFWGRLASFIAKTPVVISALHSTGWPDGVGRLNRTLTRITDGFIAVAERHGRYLRDEEGFTAEKVHVIPNGIDTSLFQPDITAGHAIRKELQIPIDAPVCGILAALRQEKNHEMFLKGAAMIRTQFPDARFVIVGDGPQRNRLEQLTKTLRLCDCVHFLGTRNDVPSILASLNVLMLTSKMEANPVSILESLSTEVPVVATRVGSVPDTVIDDQTGFTVAPGDVADLAKKVAIILNRPEQASRMGQMGRRLVQENWSVDNMVRGYEDLITQIYDSKAWPAGGPEQRTATSDENSESGKLLSCDS